jgi:hypothetical protein
MNTWFCNERTHKVVSKRTADKNTHTQHQLLTHLALRLVRVRFENVLDTRGHDAQARSRRGAASGEGRRAGGQDADDDLRACALSFMFVSSSTSDEGTDSRQTRMRARTLEIFWKSATRSFFLTMRSERIHARHAVLHLATVAEPHPLALHDRVDVLA